MAEYRRWYDNDPVLKEALELLSMATDEEKGDAAQFLLNLQNEVAKDVIESLYEQIKDYQENGNRWYDLNSTVRTAINMLENCPFSTQKAIAKEMAKLVVDKIKEDKDENEDEE